MSVIDSSAGSVTFHVSTVGDDTWSGAADRPFASLERARDAVRALKAGSGGLPPGGVEVIVHGGHYHMHQAFVLDAADSGDATRPVVYRAAAGETPVFSGGVTLNGFTPVRDAAVLARLPETARDHVVQVDLKACGVASIIPLTLGGFCSGGGFVTHPVMELFVNDEPQFLARWPNPGEPLCRIASVTVADGHSIHGMPGSKTGDFVYDGDRPARWADEAEIWLHGYWFFEWADCYERVVTLDPVARRITLEPPYSKYGYRAGEGFFALNVLAELDTPGEWYIDRASSMLYFYPPTDLASATVTLSIQPFTFVQLRDAAHITLQGLTWEMGCGDAVSIVNGNDCTLAGCTIRRFGGQGVVIDGGARHSLRACDIHSMGRGGATVRGGDRRTLTPGGHTIENCEIHDLSRIDRTYTSAVVLDGVGNRIAHNLLHDIQCSAMRVNGNDHLVEYNEVFRVVQETDDQGGMDMFGDATYRGNVIRYNYWHHIGNWHGRGHEPRCGQGGVRLDDAISGVQVYGNVFYRCTAGHHGFGGVQIHGGKDNEVWNNCFVECKAAVSFNAWGDERWRAFTTNAMTKPGIDAALYLARYPRLATLGEDHDTNLIRHNLAWKCHAFTLRDAGRSTLRDNLEVADDPGFADAASGDFTLAADAPGLGGMDFTPIPFARIGLYQDALRPTLPTAAVQQARAEN